MYNNKLASSVQRDYQQAAHNHRLIKESGYRGNRLNGTTISLAITSVVTFVIALTQITNL